MPFEKGHKGEGGRPKGSKNKQRLIRYSPKEWLRITKHNVYDPEYIDYLIQNNLPLDEYIDKFNEKHNPETRKNSKKRKNNDKDV